MRGRRPYTQPLLTSCSPQSQLPLAEYRGRNSSREWLVGERLSLLRQGRRRVLGPLAPVPLEGNVVRVRVGHPWRCALKNRAAVMIRVSCENRQDWWEAAEREQPVSPVPAVAPIPAQANRWSA